MTNANILMIATSAAQMDNGEATGLWLEELTTPFYAFTDAGAQVTLASIRGGAIPVDLRSIAPEGENDASVERYLKDKEVQDEVGATPRFTDIDPAGFDALFLPGGHGTMFDYPNDADLHALIEAFDRAGKVVAAVCHGPAALVGPKAEDGTPLVQGRRIAAFTDSEEHAVGLQDAVPFLLESRLKELGAKHEAAPDFEPFALRDGNLVTGQNPASAQKTADLVFEALADIRKAA
ncbi:type 1 glutamine amidotransferase domain-containing protein [Tateyamaria omphalii]|uniref:Glutamine amidotransferase n=1 Tax=Tateyamaria omphalii TaxID=299262 RepID=A0A1P8MX30_9RHOB|nr:type 1 glutamine amidotransferase domain-containing protein [Tateyamaria omphalii]APX12568.1 glutamine amidotransferase [Tateyamaria omphalii]